jgi:hypothetical protein
LFLSNYSVTTAAEAFDNNGFPTFVGIDGSGRSAGKRADNCTTKSVALIINFAQNCAGPGPKDGGPDSLLIKSVLVARERLTGC